MSCEVAGNPFPGPQPYRAADRACFFGRKDISQKLLNRILAAPCVTLFGPSGSGKSSLMQASVIPLLMEQYGFRVVRIDGWLAGEAPLERLSHAMFAQLELGEPPEGMNPRELLDEALRLAERRSERPILIFLDQLEQPLLPDRSADQLHELLEGLEALARAPVRGLQLVLALREDYLGRFRDEARGNRALQDPGFRLGPLTVKEMAQVAYKVLSTPVPAQKWRFEDLRALLMQVRTAGQSATDQAEVQAAFAQIVCRTLWEEQRTGKSTAGPVEAEPILHRYLDATLDSLGSLRPAALKLLEEHLVARDGSRTLLTQREAEEVLPVGGAAAQVLDTLERAAVLHAEQHQGGRYFELGHDWLAKKVLELKRERLQEEEKARKRQQEALRRQQESAARRKLLFLTAAACAVALLLLGLFLWGLGAQVRARANEQRAFNLSLMAGAREQMQRGQPAMAGKLLAEVTHPENVENWEELALEALDSNFLEVTLQGPSGEAFNAASFSPDGQHIITASDDGTARVWQTDNNAKPQVLVGHTGPVTSAEFSQDGQFIVTASQDGTARLWHAQDAEMLRVFQHEGPVRSAGFSPDGQSIVTVSRDGSAWVWRTDDAARPFDELSRGPGKRVNFAAFSPDPKVPRIVTTSWDRSAQVWQADGSGHFSLRQELPQRHEGPVNAAAFSRDGQRIVTASQDGTALLWRAAGPEPSFQLDKQLVGHKGALQSAAFSPTGRFIITASQDGTARVWRTRASGSAVVITVLKGHTGPVTAATAFDRADQDDLRVVTASLDGTARVWHADLRNQPVVTHVMEHAESVTDAGYSPDGQLIVTASQDGVARVWHADGSQPPIELRSHTASLTSAAFSPDPKVPRIVTTSWDRTAQVWELRSGGWEATPPLKHPAPVQSAAFSPDGYRIVTAAQDGIARVWQTDNSQPPIELKGYTSPLTDAAFSPDGRFIVTASRDRTARVWHADGSGETRTLRGHLGSVTSAAFSPDGRLIVTTSQDGTARVWQADGSGQPLDEPLHILRHEGPVQSATFSSDGQFIVTTSWDATARIWRTDGTGHPRVMKGHEGPVRSAAFRGDDQRLVTAAWDGTARIWRLPELKTPTLQTLLQQLQERNRDCLPSAMRQKHLKEDKEEARKGYEQCELEHHRVPSQAVALRSESLAAGSPRRM
jgi:WD40 repeat protein